MGYSCYYCGKAIRDDLIVLNTIREREQFERFPSGDKRLRTTEGEGTLTTRYLNPQTYVAGLCRRCVARSRKDMLGMVSREQSSLSRSSTRLLGILSLLLALPLFIWPDFSIQFHLPVSAFQIGSAFAVLGLLLLLLSARTKQPESRRLLQERIKKLSPHSILEFSMRAFFPMTITPLNAERKAGSDEAVQPVQVGIVPVDQLDSMISREILLPAVLRYETMPTVNLVGWKRRHWLDMQWNDQVRNNKHIEQRFVQTCLQAESQPLQNYRERLQTINPSALMAFRMQTGLQGSAGHE